MKLRTQIVAFSLAAAAVATLVGCIGLFQTGRLGTAVEDAVVAGQALQLSQEADMMHDAVRGDGQLALLGVLDKRPERITEAEAGLKEHGRKFNEALMQLEALPLSVESQLALKEARPNVKTYLEAAEHMVSAAKLGARPPQEVSEALQNTFAQLETKMGALSDAIEKNGTELNTHAAATVAQTRLAIGIALTAAAVAMVGLGLWLARRMTQPMAHAVAIADQLSQGDLTAEVRPFGNDETVRLLGSMARMQNSFAGIVREVKDNADRVAHASAEIAQGNMDLSQRTEQQATALELTSTSMRQLGTTVGQNADNATQANDLALGASDVAVKGGEVVGQVVHTMKGINDSSKEISDIITVIDSIAFQTNILALNAAVEAARAGEQGRGFAVVAAEVRSLAQRSAEAAKAIKSLITVSVERVEQGSKLVDQAGTTMNEVVAAIRRVTDIVGEISSASAAQSSGVSQVGQAIAQMDQTTQQNAALVEQSAAAAESLKKPGRQAGRHGGGLQARRWLAGRAGRGPERHDARAEANARSGGRRRGAPDRAARAESGEERRAPAPEDHIPAGSDPARGGGGRRRRRLDELLTDPLRGPPAAWARPLTPARRQCARWKSPPGSPSSSLPGRSASHPVPVRSRR